MSQQLVKKGSDGRYSNVMPKSWIEAIKDKGTGQTLVEILQGFNMYFLPYNGNTSATRCSVPMILRKKGLWITYVKYDGNVYTEWYAASDIDDKSWGDSSNWRIGNNTLVGDITISANGNWVINGAETEFKAVGEKGNTPLIRVANNRLQVSYDLGDTYRNVTENPVYTQFRNYNNKIQVSTDLGATWTDASDEIAAYFRWQATTGDTQANNVGRLQISRDKKTWTNLSNDIINNLHISKYIGANESLPTSGIAEGTIYAKGPTYAVEDTSNSNPIYRLWVYAWKGNTLAWQDNGEFQSIAAGIVLEKGSNENAVMSQKATTKAIHEVLYDVSTNNDGAVFESLKALLSSSNLNTLIPTSVRHGGMSIRFVQSSDNKYVLYRLMAQNFTTDVTLWQGVDDEPTAGSENLIKSGGVNFAISQGAYVKTSPSGAGDLNIADNDGHVILQLENGDIKTKKFDSKHTPNITDGKNDLSFADENENIVFCVKQGHIFTKYFSSYVIKNVDCIGDSMVMGAEWMGYFENMLQQNLGPKYNVRNYGIGGETKATIAARIGSSAVHFNTSFTLPSDGSNVKLPTMYSRTDGYEVLPLKMGNANVVNPCYINGIECTMSYSNGYYYLHSNNVLPRDLLIRANSNLIMSTGKQIQESYCCIVWFGQNRPSEISMTTEYLDSLVLSYEQIINQLPHNNFIFIGLHLLGYATNNLAEYYENKMYNMVGNKFFNIREYSCSDLIYDAGIVPNEKDLQEMSLGQCPESLLIDGTHFKPAVNDCVGKRLFELMNELGYVN